MAADEYYDSIGQVLSYVLSAGDRIVGQRGHETGKFFVIDRDGTELDFYAQPNDRYFLIVYEFSLIGQIVSAYRDENQLLRGHLEKYDIDDTKIRDEDLNERVAFERIRDVGENEAERVLSDIGAHVIHSDCRINNRTTHNRWSEQQDEELWDGVAVAGLLYPYEDNFTPRDYEQVAQEVISVGNQIEESMAKLDVLQEIGFD